VRGEIEMFRFRVCCAQWRTGVWREERGAARLDKIFYLY